MQIHLLNERFRQQQQILWAGSGAVQVTVTHRRRAPAAR
jgi:hypothetical protein